MVGEILSGPYGQERFQLQIASGLRGIQKDKSSVRGRLYSFQFKKLDGQLLRRLRITTVIGQVEGLQWRILTK